MTIRFPKSIRRIVKFKKVEFPDLTEDAVPELISDTESEPEDHYDRVADAGFVEAFYSRPLNEEGDIDTCNGIPPHNVLIDCGESFIEDSEQEEKDYQAPSSRVPNPNRICMAGVKPVGPEDNAQNLGWMAAALVNHSVSTRRPIDTALRTTHSEVIWQMSKLSETSIRQDFLPVFDHAFDPQDLEDDVWSEPSIKITKIAIATWGRTLAQLVNYFWRRAERSEYIDLEDRVVGLSLRLKQDPCDMKAVCAFYWSLFKFLTRRCMFRIGEMEVMGTYHAQCKEAKAQEKMWQLQGEVFTVGVDFGFIDDNADWGLTSSNLNMQQAL
jgi:hypothetical protein